MGNFVSGVPKPSGDPIRALDMVAASRRARAIIDQADSGRIAALLDDFNTMFEPA
jgi:hypothetical protein